MAPWWSPRPLGPLAAPSRPGGARLAFPAAGRGRALPGTYDRRAGCEL